jgi:hypothetical protein
VPNLAVGVAQRNKRFLKSITPGIAPSRGTSPDGIRLPLTWMATTDLRGRLQGEPSPTFLPPPQASGPTRQDGAARPPCTAPRSGSPARGETSAGLGEHVTFERLPGAATTVLRAFDLGANRVAVVRLRPGSECISPSDRHAPPGPVAGMPDDPAPSPAQPRSARGSSWRSSPGTRVQAVATSDLGIHRHLLVRPGEQHAPLVAGAALRGSGSRMSAVLPNASRPRDRLARAGR